MAARRAYWKGYLKLSLVTCPVALYPASSQSKKTHFHQINRKTGNRLRQQMVDEETGRPVEREYRSNVIDLMAALKQSLKGRGEAKGAAHRPVKRKAAKRHR